MIVKDGPVVEMLVDPILEKVQVSEIDHEPVVVQVVCPESQSNGPAVPVEAGAAAALVKGLAMGQGMSR